MIETYGLVVLIAVAVVGIIYAARDAKVSDAEAKLRAQHIVDEEDYSYACAAKYIDSLDVCPKCNQVDDVIGSYQDCMDVKLIRCGNIWHGFKPYRWIEMQVDPDWKARMRKDAIALGRSLQKRKELYEQLSNH